MRVATVQGLRLEDVMRSFDMSSVGDLLLGHDR